MKIYLDIMYSDFWADPHQPEHPRRLAGTGPGAAHRDGPVVHAQVIAAFARRARQWTWCRSGTRSGTGSCGPPARSTALTAVAGPTSRSCSRRASRGPRPGNPRGHQLLIMMHYDQGADFTDSSAFYSQLESYGVPFGVIGLSYYPVLRSRRSRSSRRTWTGSRASSASPSWRPRPSTRGRSPTATTRPATARVTSPGRPARSSRLPGDAGWPAVLRDRRAVDPRAGPWRAGDGAVLLGARLDPRCALGAGCGHRVAQCQHDPVQLRGQALPSINIFRNPAPVCERQSPDSIPCVTGG